MPRAFGRLVSAHALPMAGLPRAGGVEGLVTVTAIVFAALSSALEPVGMPALTAPFVFVVWLFVLAVPSLPRLRRA